MIPFQLCTSQNNVSWHRSKVTVNIRAQCVICYYCVVHMTVAVYHGQEMSPESAHYGHRVIVLAIHQPVTSDSVSSHVRYVCSSENVKMTVKPRPLSVQVRSVAKRNTQIVIKRTRLHIYRNSASRWNPSKVLVATRKASPYTKSVIDDTQSSLCTKSMNNIESLAT